MQSRPTLPNPETAAYRAVVQLPDDVTTVRAKLVYLYLRVARRADVAEIAGAVREPQLRLYPALEYLVELGYVQQRGSTFAIAEG